MSGDKMRSYVTDCPFDSVTVKQDFYVLSAICKQCQNIEWNSRCWPLAKEKWKSRTGSSLLDLLTTEWTGCQAVCTLVPKTQAEHFVACRLRNYHGRYLLCWWNVPDYVRIKSHCGRLCFHVSHCDIQSWLWEPWPFVSDIAIFVLKRDVKL